MSTRQRLEYELNNLRAEYKKANKEEQLKLSERAEEIKVLLNNLCYSCKEEPRRFNEYYCSRQCNDDYYKPKEKGVRHKITYMQEKLLEMGRNSKIK